MVALVLHFGCTHLLVTCVLIVRQTVMLRVFHQEMLIVQDGPHHISHYFCVMLVCHRGKPTSSKDRKAC